MQKRKLGKPALEVSAVALDCMRMSFPYGPPKDKQEVIKLLHAAVERGVIATKFGFAFSRNGDPQGMTRAKLTQPWPAWRKTW